MKLLLKIIVGLVGLIVVAILMLPLVLSGDWIRVEAEKAATTALGREVVVAGKPKISIFPTSVTVDEMTIANANGFSAPYLVKVERAKLGVKLLPLFANTIELTTFSLESPEINLETKPDGTVNWALGEKLTEATPAPSTDDTIPIGDLKLGTVQIIDGTVTFENSTNSVYRAENANLDITLTSLDKPLVIAGTMIMQGEPAKINATMTTPRSFIEDKAAELMLKMAVGSNIAETNLTLADPLQFEGSLDVDIPALRALIVLTGATINTPNGFEKVRLKGKVSGDADTISFLEGTLLTFDQIAGTGTLAIDVSGERPMIQGALSVASLDLHPYLPAEESSAPKKGAAFPPWSTEVLDFSALEEVDLDLKLEADDIRLPMMAIGKSSLNLIANAGNITATLTEMKLYGGNGSGFVKIDTGRDTTVFAPKLTLTGIDVGAFMTDLAGITRLKGKGDVTVDLNTRGTTENAWVSALNGTITAKLAEGSLEGINFGKIARGAYQAYTSVQQDGFNMTTLGQTFGQLTTTARGAAEQTDFSAMNLEIAVINGVAATKNLSITGPYFAINGEGNVNLPGQTMQMTLIPSVSAIQGETIKSLPVPIMVSGTFNDPQIGLDINSTIRGVATKKLTDVLKIREGKLPAASDSVQDALSGAARNELNKLLGGKSVTQESDPDTPEDDTEKPDPKSELLKLGIGALLGKEKTPDPEPDNKP